MSRTVSFGLPGIPGAKGRPRFTKQGHAFTDAKTRAAEQSLLAAFLIAHKRTDPHEGPVRMTVVATFPVPKSWPKWKRELAERGAWPHTSKPDADNLLKAVNDSLNRHAYLDDSQITQSIVVKEYGRVPSTFVKLELLDVPERVTARPESDSRTEEPRAVGAAGVLDETARESRHARV